MECTSLTKTKTKTKAKPRRAGFRQMGQTRRARARHRCAQASQTQKCLGSQGVLLVSVGLCVFLAFRRASGVLIPGRGASNPDFTSQETLPCCVALAKSSSAVCSALLLSPVRTFYLSSCPAQCTLCTLCWPAAGLRVMSRMQASPCRRYKASVPFLQNRNS